MPNFTKEDLASLGRILVDLCDPAAGSSGGDFGSDPAAISGLTYIYLNRQAINGFDYGWYQRKAQEGTGQIVNMPLPNAALTATLKKIRIAEKLKNDPNYNSHKIIFDLEGKSGARYSIEGGWKSKQGGVTVPVRMLLSSMQFADLSRPITITTNVSPDKATVSFANVFQDGVQLYPEKGQVAEGNFVDILKHLTKTHNIPFELQKADPQQAAPAQGYGQPMPQQPYGQQQPPQQGYGQQPQPVAPAYQNPVQTPGLTYGAATPNGQQAPMAAQQQAYPQPVQPVYGQPAPAQFAPPPQQGYYPQQPAPVAGLPDLADFNTLGNTVAPGGHNPSDINYDDIPF